MFTAIETGMNFIDVSPYYGHYKAETVLGKALQKQNACNQKPHCRKRSSIIVLKTQYIVNKTHFYAKVAHHKTCYGLRCLGRFFANAFRFNLRTKAQYVVN